MHMMYLHLLADHLAVQSQLSKSPTGCLLCIGLPCVMPYKSQQHNMGSVLMFRK